MADEPKEHDPLHDVFWFVGVIIVLVVLWYLAGGPGRSDLRGIFLSPPAPLGNGNAYGPNPQPQDNSYQTETVQAPEQISTSTGY